MNNTEIIKTFIEAEKEFGLVPLINKAFGKNVKVNLGFSKKVCEESIDELMLSVRSSNALKRAGILTIGEVIDTIDAGALNSLRNLGTKSRNEIQTKILVFGYDDLTEKEKAEFFEKLVEDNRQ